MKTRYKYRIIPTTSQKIALAKLFGCTRVVWNDALFFCHEIYNKGGKYPGESQLQKQFITQAKKTKDREWLKEVSNIPLQQSLRDLGQAYANFFKSCSGERKGKKIKPPRFKKRKSAQSAKFRIGGFKINQHNVYLAKIGKLKIKWSRLLPSKPSSVTVIKDASERYFLSFVVEINPDKLPDNNNFIGIDLGIIDFAAFSNGEKVKAPKPLKKRLKRLKKAQRQLSKKTQGSKRRERARKQVAKLHAKIADIRQDFLHKLSTKVISENQTIALEDLNVSGLLKNRKLSRAISDLGWRSFRTMLEAKSQVYGRDLRIVNRWEATTQKCSCCGEKGGKKRSADAPSHGESSAVLAVSVEEQLANPKGASPRTKLELNIREWACLFCQTVHDRDINAATNILQVAEGHSETLNERGGKRKTISKVAASCETLTAFKPVQLSLF